MQKDDGKAGGSVQQRRLEKEGTIHRQALRRTVGRQKMNFSTVPSELSEFERISKRGRTDVPLAERQRLADWSQAAESVDKAGDPFGELGG